MKRLGPRELHPVPARVAGAAIVAIMPRRADSLRPVLCPKCGRPVADYFAEPDGFGWVFPRRPPLHEALRPVDATEFGLPPNFHEWTTTMRCVCGATPSYRTSQVAALAKATAEAQPSGERTGPRPPRQSRAIRLPS
jgi:hypothetical protein